MTDILDGPNALAERIETNMGLRWVDDQMVDPEGARAYADLHGYGPEYEGVPPGYGAALTMRVVLQVLHDNRLGLPFDRNVHAAQDLEWLAPLRAGAILQTAALVENVKVRERAVFFDVVTSSVQDGVPVLRGVATQAVRHG